jgi:putative hemolysin
MAVFIISVLIALVVSTVCSLMEAALLSLTPAQIADVAGTHPHLGDRWRGFKRNIEQPISAILILNTAAHTIGAAVAGAQFDGLFGHKWIWAFSLVFTYLMLQFTEILPKTLGVRYNRRLAPVIAQPLSWMILALRPISYVVRLINRPFEEGARKERPEVSLDEITALAGLARLSKLIGAHQERIIRGASRLSRMRVAQVMIPVDQVTFLSTSQRLMDAVLTAHLDPHTRFPICEEGDRNRVLGYVNFKEMIYYARTNPSDQSLRGVVRPVRFVAPEQPAGELLSLFVEEHVHIALVRDNQGSTLGLITLEDVVEELVGEIEDEFDRPPRMLHPLTGNTWMVGGGVPVLELASRVGVTLADPRGDLSTWLIGRISRIPRPGEVHREGGLEFMIRRIRRGKIFEVAVSRPASPPTQ